MQQAEIHTNKGVITVELFPNEAPKTVENFAKLSTEGFYEGTMFHRVIKDFMIQGGDPNSKDDDWSNDGRGGPGYMFEDEINSHKVERGALAMANAGPNTNGSQFFIVTAEAAPWLDGLHTVFGNVIDGMDVVNQIATVSVNENDHPTVDIVIEKIIIK
ncbi:MAG: peptidylprolyl isomerase [Candidatus Ryanbacteria bacterium CG10_big_fil_rev_8_21_14_0_10_43_42]|uniref:Peptidyl-prolyl cis-trans isomerase n=1 Tax=Candidatus Ryanbacteria bacterium CG10_big_fil_rev_8_21_14_0_10_43_42 TaxID=1974864 RepID=A0A2M8KY83_9BACT|nr:MAG: peptidylprolyl isomerase [Candidatus Ryanbacteria bacterium CG10_big_fil_rev_8_21_14_0_10_43_42]